MFAQALPIALFIALAESLGLAALLAIRARQVAGGRYLILFLVGVAVWIVGCQLPAWFGPGLIRPAGMLIGSSVLTATVFVHFGLVFCGITWPRGLLTGCYLVSGLVACATFIWPPGSFIPWAGLDYFFVPTIMGWIVGSVWGVLSIAGHGVMFASWFRARGLRRRQITALCLASSWGALSVAGYGFYPLGLDLAPYPLLLLPAYPVILVYGILRYELMIVNVWARRAVAWTLLIMAGSGFVIVVTGFIVPFNTPVSGFMLSALIILAFFTAGLVLDPFRALAARLVYPGARLVDGD